MNNPKGIREQREAKKKSFDIGGNRMWRRSEGHTSGCDWWISIRSVDNTQDWWFPCVFCFPKSRINENGGNQIRQCKKSEEKTSPFIHN